MKMSLLSRPRMLQAFKVCYFRNLLKSKNLNLIYKQNAPQKCWPPTLPKSNPLHPRNYPQLLLLSSRRWTKKPTPSAPFRRANHGHVWMERHWHPALPPPLWDPVCCWPDPAATQSTKEWSNDRKRFRQVPLSPRIGTPAGWAAAIPTQPCTISAVDYRACRVSSGAPPSVARCDSTAPKLPIRHPQVSLALVFDCHIFYSIHIFVVEMLPIIPRTSLDLELDLQAQHSKLETLNDEIKKLKDLKQR